MSNDLFVIQAKSRGFGSFTKEKEDEWKGSYTFIQAADTQFGMIDSYINKKPLTDVSWDAEIELTKQAIAAANKIRPRPRFFVVCGDLLDAFPGDPNKPLQEADYKRVFADLHPDIPLVCVCGNHDIGNTPTKESVDDYVKSFGDDYFAFWVGGVKFIALNSQFYEDPSLVMNLKEQQDKWLDEELKKDTTFRHLVILQHIPWFVEDPEETKKYFNVEYNLRMKMLNKFRDAGVKKIFCGHYHRNAGGFYGDMECIVTSAVGAQLGSDQSGLRLVTVTASDIQHQYYALDEVPEHVLLE